MIDPFDLNRFVTAQHTTYPQACTELAAGAKTSHWMWFVFPQLEALGRSAMAKHFGIGSLDEAAAYLAHPMLGPRLVHCTALVNAVQGRTLQQLFGSPDDLKFRSCMTLFGAVPGADAVFHAALQRWFGGRGDAMTTEWLAQHARRVEPDRTRSS